MTSITRPDNAAYNTDTPTDTPTGSVEASAAVGHPYAPSWVDHLTEWVRRAPFPAWVFYLALGLGLAALNTAAGWLDGSLPVGKILLVHVVLGFGGVYFMAQIHRLDDVAERAFETFRPVLRAEPEMADRLHYELTMLPAWPTLLSGLGGLAGSILFAALSPSELLGNLHIYTSPLAVGMQLASIIFTWAMIGTYTYHTVHQAGVVHRIYVDYTYINLFTLGPLYALSTLTARTAIGLVLGVYCWLPVIPDPFGRPERVAYGILLMVLATSAFVWPLWGAHHMLVIEKGRILGDIGLRIEALVSDVCMRTDRGKLDDIDGPNKALDILLKTQAALERVPTWPWSSETVRLLATAVLVPLFLWMITRLLERFIIF